MRPGNCGNLGNIGNVESVTCRPHYPGDGTNPSLSACRINNLEPSVTKTVTTEQAVLKGLTSVIHAG